MKKSHYMWMRSSGLYRFTPLAPPHAAAIVRWRYEPGLSLYDLAESDLAWLLAPELNYYAALDGDGALAGFACFGDDAQVAGGHYGGEALDIGFGLAPERTGRGEGRAFVSAVCDFAAGRWRAPLLRLSVATFNRRAISVYRHLGFRPTDCFVGSTRHGSLLFMTMVRAA